VDCPTTLPFASILLFLHNVAIYDTTPSSALEMAFSDNHCTILDRYWPLSSLTLRRGQWNVVICTRSLASDRNDHNIIVPKQILIKRLLRHAYLNLGSSEERQILVQKLVVPTSTKKPWRILERPHGNPCAHTGGTSTSMGRG
jgi:hypothetical protein